MAWWSQWFARSFGLTDANSPLYDRDREWGDDSERVTPATAQNVSAWWQSNRLYADVTGTLPLKFYKRTPDDDRVVERDHPVAQIISSQPNADNTTQEFWSAQALALRTLGNCYAEKSETGAGRLIALQLLPFGTLPYRNNDGELRYRFYDRGKQEDMPREKIFHTRSFYAGGDLGLSPLSAAHRSLSTTMATERAVAQTFSRGMRAKGFFVMPNGAKLTPDQRKEAYKTLVTPFSGRDGKDWGILEGGVDAKLININPKDAEMLLNRGFNLEEVCRYTGIPPILVGHASSGQTMWGTGVENIILSWRTLGLDAHLSTIEKSINRWLLSPTDRLVYYAEFDRDGLMQIDIKARSEYVAQQIQNAQMTPNEGRKKQNRPRMQYGDDLMINSTLIPLKDAGKTRAAVAPVPAPPDSAPARDAIPGEPAQ